MGFPVVAVGSVSWVDRQIIDEICIYSSHSKADALAMVHTDHLMCDLINHRELSSHKVSGSSTAQLPPPSARLWGPKLGRHLF